ncbi:septal ring lytic transglycosylase RlpA family protein [Acetobacter suratthaniensis]|uniref:Endolytic peptidoglycan transglycosylase RlpA n=1 Tax=Acetobacter suratthaniensis TaxID=1502841 RepID=A0ABS3LMN0_9PROT|nr:septal ring lytic transglycosylase RlpA family protein [Acetobacter suratthaniensis]
MPVQNRRRARWLTVLAALIAGGGSVAARAGDLPERSGTAQSGAIQAGGTPWADSVSRALQARSQEDTALRDFGGTQAGAGQHGRPIQTGMASWYGGRFHHRRTSSGSPFDRASLTAAHPTAPLGSKLRVTSEETGRSVVVTVNDRGPYKKGRIIDLSHAAAAQIGMLGSGVAHVRVETATAHEVAEAPEDLGLGADELILPPSHIAAGSRTKIRHGVSAHTHAGRRIVARR